DVIAEAPAPEPSRQKQPDAVRHVEGGLSEECLEGGIAPGRHHDLGVGGGDDVGAAVAGPRLVDPPHDQGDGLVVGDVVHPDAEYAYRRDLTPGGRRKRRPYGRGRACPAHLRPLSAPERGLGGEVGHAFPSPARYDRSSRSTTWQTSSSRPRC